MNRQRDSVPVAFNWLPAYLERLRDYGVSVQDSENTALEPARRIFISPEGWAHAAQQAAELGCRWSAAWADETRTGIVVHALLEQAGDYLCLATRISLEAAVLPSQAGIYTAAARPERHMQDMLGVRFENHPDPRRWTRHRAWGEGAYPLRRSFPVAGAPRRMTPADTGYRFRDVQGSGVYEIPVGPVHAGIIEPGHFRFQAVGEEVLSLEERLGYVHKGVEKIAVGMAPDELARLAGRVSGDTTVSHAWAACQALERAFGCAVPERALFLRAVLAERERVANHLGDIGAICNDVGFAFAQSQFARLRERWQRTSADLFGHRLLMDCVILGGVAVDLDGRGREMLRADHWTLRGELEGLFDILGDHPPLDERLLTTGHLGCRDARQLGVLGYVGRASGQGYDLRRDQPYAPYDRFTLQVPLYEEGDVAARMRVRMDETHASLDLMDALLAGLPAGETAVALGAAGEREGLGCVEGWRGEIVTYVRLDEAGRVARFFPRDPSWLNWPALERLISGNIVADFPVCDKSVNASYSGHDL